MTDRAKFEQMLEYLINEDKSKAEELFHELVVAKSREIYENLLDDDIQVEASEEDDEEEDMEENFDMGMQEVGADPADDMMGDLEDGDEMGDEEGGSEAATKDDVMDIKDALEDLKAEFEAMLAGEHGEEHSEEDGEEEMGDEEGEEEMEDHQFEASNDDDEEEDDMEEGMVREYVEKVAPAKMGDNGQNSRSTVAGKNDMGGTTANIAKGGTSTTGGTKGGLLNPSTKDLNSGNVNVPGGKAGVKHLKGVSKPAGGDNGQNTKSTLGR
jgi:hypothetical protein